MENPYASPTSDIEPARVSAWVRSVRVVATLLIIQGISECGIGFLLIYQWEKSVISVTIIILEFILGGIKIVAGVRNYQYRNRALGIVALAVAPLSIFTFFCLPSAMVILICGLVVYLNRDVKRVFARGPGNE